MYANVTDWRAILRNPDPEDGWNFRYELAPGLIVRRGDKCHVRSPRRVDCWDATFVAHREVNWVGDDEHNRFYIKWDALNMRHNNVYEEIRTYRLKRVYTKTGRMFERVWTETDEVWMDSTHDTRMRPDNEVNYYEG